MKTVAIITPSIGSKHLTRCMQSVQSQNYQLIEHLIVADGPPFHDGVCIQVAGLTTKRFPVHVQNLPYNTGGDFFRGYRICVAFGYLVNADIVMYLDDDNWIDVDHVKNCVSAISDFSVDWSFATRRIMKENGEFMVDDDCDSLGYWRRDASYRGPADLLASEFIEYYAAYPFLVDTNCYAIRRSLLMELGHLFLGRDSFFASQLVRSRAGACTGARTVNYRVRSSSESGAYDYFDRGNRSSAMRYGVDYPWNTSRRCEPIAARNFLSAFPASQIKPA